MPLGTEAQGRFEATRTALDTTAYVETPEHVRFQYRIAGPAQRALAYLIDLAVRLALAIPVLFFWGIGTEGFAGFGMAVILILLFLLEWGYFVLLETLMGGQSFGKRALGLRVVKQGGFPLRFTDSVLRNLLRAADFLPMVYSLGIAVMVFDPLFRRLGDLVAGTVVVSEKQFGLAEAVRIFPDPSPAELANLPERLSLSPREIEAIALFLRRLDRLNPARQEELAEMIAPVFAKRMDARYRDPVRFLALLYVRAVGRHR